MNKLSQIRWDAATTPHTRTFELHDHIALSSSAVVNDTRLENAAPPTAYLEELTPNSHITVVDENTHESAFSFAKFLKIW